MKLRLGSDSTWLGQAERLGFFPTLRNLRAEVWMLCRSQACGPPWTPSPRRFEALGGSGTFRNFQLTFGTGENALITLPLWRGSSRALVGFLCGGPHLECPDRSTNNRRRMAMTSILKVLLVAVTLVGSTVLAVAAPHANRYLAPAESFTDQSSGYQPVSPPPWAW